MSTNEYVPDYLDSPGDTVREYAEGLGFSRRSLAAKTGLRLETVSGLYSGDVTIDEDVASRLERGLGRPARFWLALESRYLDDVARLGR